MTATMLVRARCPGNPCHIWIVSLFDKLGHCRRCHEVPVIIPGVVDPTATSECLHEGECVQRKNRPLRQP
jgi:hypothetical protein